MRGSGEAFIFETVCQFFNRIFNDIIIYLVSVLFQQHTDQVSLMLSITTALAVGHSFAPSDVKCRSAVLFTCAGFHPTAQAYNPTIISSTMLMSAS